MNIYQYIVMVVTALIGMYAAYRWGYEQRVSDAGGREMIAEQAEVRLVRDIDSVPMGSMMVITYPGHLTNEQRTRIQQLVEEKVGERMKVMVLEGGLKATVLSENSVDIQKDSPWTNK